MTVIVLRHDLASRLDRFRIPCFHTRYLPHLTLYKAEALEDTVLGTRDGDLVWTTRIVVGAVDKIVPHLSISIQCAIAMSIPAHTLTAKQPCTGLVLVPHGERGVQPVLDVGVP